MTRITTLLITCLALAIAAATVGNAQRGMSRMPTIIPQTPGTTGSGTTLTPLPAPSLTPILPTVKTPKLKIQRPAAAVPVRPARPAKRVK